MKLQAKSCIFILLSCVLSACGAEDTIHNSEIQAQNNSALLSQGLQNSDPTQDKYGAIPGPRDCFWSRGPHSADPYINVAYPDANVFYWAATFSMPEGSELHLEGDYAHARYQSFISYNEKGVPIESLADYLTAPSAGGTKLGSIENNRIVQFASSDKDETLRQYAQASEAAKKGVNPYITGNRRDLTNRRYSVEILNQAPGTERAIGVRSDEGDVNLLHTPAYGPDQQMILYRIYLPDEGKGPSGGVALPTPVLKLADGSTLRGSETCAALNAKQQLQLDLNAVGVTPKLYRTLIDQPGKPDTHPAQNPAKWYIQLDRKSLLGIYTGEMSENPRRSEGGFYPNLDNQYIRTIVNRKHGKVFLVRGKMPTTPNTFNGDKIMGDGELRYWSICSNQGFVNTRVNDCLFDEEVPLDENGFYTVLVSRAEDRPRNARPECGLSWLPMADDGDGMFDPDVSIVQIRNMLASPDFKHAIQNVDEQANLEAVMGPYMPRTQYLMPNQVESFFPCGGLD